MNQGVIWFLPFEEQLIVWLQHLGEGTILQTILFYLNNFFSFLGEEIICIAVMGFVYWGLDKKRGERIGAAIMLTNVAEDESFVMPLLELIASPLLVLGFSAGGAALFHRKDLK